MPNKSCAILSFSENSASAAAPITALTPWPSTYLYRIAQEAINNARKHGEADQVTISLRSSPKGLILKIRDNGIGIPKIPKKSGMGLSIMNRRASEIGATVSVRRGQKKGTVVTCTLPVRSQSGSQSVRSKSIRFFENEV